MKNWLAVTKRLGSHSLFFLSLSYARVSWLTPVIEVAFVGKMDQDFLDT